MLNDVKFLNVYYPGGEDIGSFYLDCLLNSTSFKMCLGFFSTSGFKSLSIGFSYFIYNGGKVQFIINNLLSKEDKDAINNGLDPKFHFVVENELIKSIKLLDKILSKRDRFFFKCISWLIHINRVEILIVSPISRIGISHHKFGIFSDKDNNKVAFTGSANFSERALEYNLENLVAFTSWENEKESETVNEFDKYFNNIWFKKEKSLIYIPVDKIKIVIRENFPVNNIEELLTEEKTIIEDNSRKTSISFKKKINILRKKIYAISEETKKEPHLPSNIKLRDYQLAAYDKWYKKKYQGLFEMATGTGKTIIALNCALRIFQKEKKLNALILVPTIPLLLQWEKELESCNFENIILAYGNNKDWYEQCLRNINKTRLFNNHSFCILSTYKTFVKKNFNNIVKKFGEDTLLIADEVHNMGADTIVKKLPFNIKRRIGLTATPTRYFDETGTKSILKFFNSEFKPTIKFDLRDAINHGFLCKYYYYPKIVKLLPDELEEYKDITTRLLRYFDKEKKRFIDSEKVTKLLIIRKRIIHKAKNKLKVLKEILDELVAQNIELNYILVYVPEGFDKDEDIRLINNFSKIIAFDYKLKQCQFIDGTKDKNKILKKFAQGDLQILTSMKCLDEGVDIKRAEIAIFCASTGNPRQFIQRRGRILRVHKEKKFAKIYDMIVIPEYNSLKSNIKSMEKSIIEGELRRVYEFANIAENKYSALKYLDPIISKFGIYIF